MNKKRLALLVAYMTILLSYTDKIEASTDLADEAVICDVEDTNQPIKLRNYNPTVLVEKDTMIFAGPGLNYDKLDPISSMDGVKIVSKSIDNWYLVEYDNLYGFIDGDCLALKDSNYTDLFNINQNVMAMNDTNIMEEDNKESEILGLLKEKAKIQIIQKLENDWYEVDYMGDSAYVESDDVKINYDYDIPNKFYKVIWIKKDTGLYSNGRMIQVLSKYECGEVYNETNDEYFISTEDMCGYVKKEDAEVLEGTFVIVDESTQSLKLYEDNEVVLESPVVSGKTGHETNKGKHKVLNKELNRTLVGEGGSYRSFVNYWMRFDNDQEGLHDATWRNTFGPAVSRDNGSHGCVNLPLDIAAQLYDELELGDTVIIKK